MTKTPDSGWIVPDWPAPVHVRALSTTRCGGVSTGRYGLADGAAGGLNLGMHVGDDAAAVAANRAALADVLPAAPYWLEQVHGTAVAGADLPADEGDQPVRADASVAARPDRVCAIMTADCLPVLLCDRRGTVVGAAHAGWRGLCAGVIEATVERMRAELSARGAAGETGNVAWLAWLGPAIGPQRFEVGPEVREAFLAQALPHERAVVDGAFRPGMPGKFMADIHALARSRLARVGCTDVFGGTMCTVTESQRFYSFRRDGVTGRMASLIWLDA